MNERIREILTQCQQESIDGPEYPHWTDFEKFAELIVRECAKKVNEDTTPDSGYTYEPWKLLEHFGVEE